MFARPRRCGPSPTGLSTPPTVGSLASHQCPTAARSSTLAGHRQQRAPDPSGATPSLFSAPSASVGRCWGARWPAIGDVRGTPQIWRQGEEEVLSFRPHHHHAERPSRQQHASSSSSPLRPGPKQSQSWAVPEHRHGRLRWLSDSSPHHCTGGFACGQVEHQRDWRAGRASPAGPSVLQQLQQLCSAACCTF